MEKGRYWVHDQQGHKKYFDNIEEARWYVTRYMKGIAKIYLEES